MSKKKLLGLFLVFGLVGAGGASALDATDQRYIDRLVKGSPESLRDVSESLYQSGATNPEVLDVAAEVLLQKYNRISGSFGLSDAMAYLCKALGASGNARYLSVLDKVADDAESRKLRSHCSKAAKGLPKKSGVAGYVAGTIDLEKLREPPPPAPAAKTPAASGKAAPAAKAKAEPAPAAAPAAKAVDFSLVREGMSSQEVADILGPPTGQTQHMTGKQFRPFNFGAKDLQRMYYLYKGVGRIEFSLKSAYEGVYRVIAIRPDPAESGYP